MRVYFVRHGETKGNSEGRYVGRTDEPLLPESIALLRAEAQKREAEGQLSKTGSFPSVDLVIASPMLRCRQTAEALYPGVPIRVQEDLREMDFGEFEYKNYQELNGNPVYQAYIDSDGQMGFPGGEPLEHFRERCCDAFRKGIVQAEEEAVESVAFVVHGGTIMAVLEAYGEPRKPYFEWRIKNGERIEGDWDDRGKVFVREG